MARQRRTQDGKYSFENFELICRRCGQKLGVHNAERPWAAEDMCIAERECDGFLAPRK